MTRFTSRSDASAYDATDPLAHLKSEFRIPDGVTYLVGHSLGPVAETALARLQETAEQDWANEIVRAWNSADWINLAAKVGGKIAPLIGARANEVVICDSVSVNLFKLAASVLPLTERRIIIEDDEFPTDQYIAKGLAGLADVDFRRVSAGQGLAALKQGGVLIKSAVNYRTAEITDMSAFEHVARQSGAFIIWDFSHATGIAPIDVVASGARLGAGCTYKYLNGGPGAPAFVYVREDIADQIVSPLPGWLGHAAPFAFEKDYRPADGAQRFIAGTPSILSLSALDGALEVYADIDMKALRQKLKTMSDFIISRAEAMGLRITSPRDANLRGGHISLIHPDGYPIVQALMAEGIMSDFRTPGTIRFGLSPLYLSMADIWDVMEILENILHNGSWDKPEFNQRSKVT